MQLPVAQRDGAVPAPSRALTAPESESEPVTRARPPRAHSQPTPALPRPAVSVPAASDAPTQYHQVALKKDDVAGVLVAIEGELKGGVFKLFDGENKLGRSESNDVCLASKWISREHAMLVHQDGVFAIVPLTEKNRTYVNDREVDGAELSDGDVVRLGHTTFRFRSIEGM